MRGFLLPVVLMLALIAACDDDGTGPTSDLIQPLETGFAWGGRVYSDSPQNPDTTYQELFVTGCESINGVRWWNIAHVYGIDTVEATYQWTNRNDGLWSRIPWGNENLEYLRAKYPATAGENYPGPMTEQIITVISTDSAVTVPAGTFKCYVYLIDDGSAVDAPVVYEFCCPGIGMVKQVAVGGITGATVTWEMTWHRCYSNYPDD